MALMQQGDFSPPGDEDVLREIRAFVAGLTGIETTIVSDHILNLLEEIEGKLPRDRQTMLDLLGRYFALSEEQRLVFRLGRRNGIYRRLADLSDRQVYSDLKSIVDRYETMERGSLDKQLSAIMNHYI